MATTDFLGGMNDPRLKPRLLRSLVRDCLVAPSPSELSYVISSVLTHGLLAEHISDSSDAKLAAAWRDAVDAWIESILSLASSKMPDQCWVGVCLLGVTCEECSSARFVTSYSLLFEKLVLHMQVPSSSRFLRLAVCASLTDLFTRLADFSNLKKDAIAFASKVIQIILQLYNDNGSDTVLEGLLDLLHTILLLFPSSMMRHYNNVEAFFISKMVLSNADLSNKVACCLALHPRVKGDEDSWSLMMQKIIIEIDTLLSDALKGLGETKGSTVVRLLIPPGRDPPPQLGVCSALKEAPQKPIKKFRELIVPTISNLMRCCCMMLSNPYPIQVSIPVHSLIALVRRLFTMDGSVQGSFMPFTTVLNQELIIYQLPALHMESLDLLFAISKGVGSQLLPHGAHVAQIFIEYFRQATLPTLRIKSYSVIQSLLTSMGVGMALYLSQVLINNAFADLNDDPGKSAALPSQQAPEDTGQALLQSSPRKRKRGSLLRKEHPNGTFKQSAVICLKPPTSLSVKIAALKALEALLTVGGSLRSECWRSDMDFLLMTVAKHACEANEEGKSCIIKAESAISRADFQLAALQALLALLLSQSHARSYYLSEGLELFRRGKLEAEPQIAAFCAHALLALEILIHPRALPLFYFEDSRHCTLDPGFNQRNLGNTLYSNQMPKTSVLPMGYPGAMNGTDDDDDELLNNMSGPVEEQKFLQHLDTLREKHGVGSTSGQETAECNQERLRNHEAEMSYPSVEIKAVIKNGSTSGQETLVMIGSDKASLDVRDTSMHISRDGMVPESEDISASDTVVEFQGISGNPEKIGNISNETVIVADASKSSVVFDRAKEPTHTYDSDSVDSLPDIVDADPDTDDDL